MVRLKGDRGCKELSTEPDMQDALVKYLTSRFLVPLADSQCIFAY